MIVAPWEFGKIIPTVTDGTRPSNSIGTTVTPLQNSYGNYAELIDGALVTHDVCGIWLNINSGMVAGQAKDTIVTIGVDPTAGTSYAALIEHLLAPCSAFCGGSNAGNTGGGISYFFPLFILAGSSIAAKASVNNGTPGTIKVQAKLFCKPTYREAMQPGRFIQTFGANTGASCGTAITPATASSEGAWTEIGTLDKDIKWLEFGVGVNDSVMATQNNGYHVDVALGDASNKKIVTKSAIFTTTNNENCNKPEACRPCVGVAGDKIYARMQNNTNALDDNVSFCAYAVG